MIVNLNPKSGSEQIPKSRAVTINNPDAVSAIIF